MGIFDEYLATLDAFPRERVEQVLAVFRRVLPEATEVISYGIPTFDLQGRHVIHCGGYSNHTGIYPTSTGMTRFEASLERYVRGRGSVQFPHSEALPLELIEAMALFRRDEVLSQKPAKSRRSL